jgi:hypothetical protein
VKYFLVGFIAAVIDATHFTINVPFVHVWSQCRQTLRRRLPDL